MKKCKPCNSNETVKGMIKKNKDNLHEWSIYRQNLTSSLARGLLASSTNMVNIFVFFRLLALNAIIYASFC